LEDRENGRLAVKLTPGDLIEIKSGAKNLNLDILAERWKDGLLEIVAEKTIAEFGRDAVEKGEVRGLGNRVAVFFPLISKILVEQANKLTDKSDQAIVKAFAQSKAIHIYIDDIDRGWSASDEDIRHISALLTAVRDISGSDQRIRFRIALRTDAYYLVRTSDETTDKIERNVVWLTWTNHEILSVITKRIATYFGRQVTEAQIGSMTQLQMTDDILSQVIETRFQGNGHWSNRPIHNVLTSLSRRRPRDMVKLMHGAARRAFNSGHSKITSRDLEASFQNYSSERVQDIINEFRTELPNIERLILGFQPSRRGKRTSESFLFATDALVTKLRNIMQNTPFSFKNGRIVTARSLMQFLYKIEFIAARKDTAEGIQRKHFDQNRFLASEVAEFGYDWEVHPAYRWALQPQSIQQVIDSVVLANE
jgi:hypothetical protein